MEENLVEEYSERIETLKNLIARAKATLELRETERDNLKLEYSNLEKECKQKYNVSLKNLAKEIENKQESVQTKLEDAESKYQALMEPKNES